MKKKFSPQDFLSRAEKVKLIEIPDSDRSKVIVLPNNKGMGFRFNCYNPEFLRDRIEKNFFDATVKEANRICENTWRLKKQQESEDFSSPLKLILYKAILMSILAFFLLVVLVYDNGNDALLYGAILLICLASGLTMTVVVRSLFAQPNFIELEAEIIKKLSEYLESENQQLYQKRGLRWILEPHFYWLELQIIN